MNIGTPVTFHSTERGRPVDRAAVISENENNGFVHLTVFARPIADIQARGGHLITNEITVPFYADNNPAAEYAGRWCGPAIPAPKFPDGMLKRLAPVNSQGPDVVIRPASKDK